MFENDSLGQSSKADSPLLTRAHALISGVLGRPLRSFASPSLTLTLASSVSLGLSRYLFLQHPSTPSLRLRLNPSVAPLSFSSSVPDDVAASPSRQLGHRGSPRRNCRVDLRIREWKKGGNAFALSQHLSLVFPVMINYGQMCCVSPPVSPAA